MIRFISSLLDRLAIVAGAFLFNQVPGFIHQYTQRLAGRVDELTYLIKELTALAAANGKTLTQYIQKFLDSADSDFVAQGQFIQSLESRVTSLTQALNHLQEVSAWSRPYYFLKEMHCDTAKATLHSFQPGLSLSFEGLFYTILGIVFGYLFYRGLAKIVQLLKIKFSSK